MGISDLFRKKNNKKPTYEYAPMPDNMRGERLIVQQQKLQKRQINIDVFKDTLARIESDERLNIRTQAAAGATYIIEEGFRAEDPRSFSEPHIDFEENLTLITARRYADHKKTAVLNFANPLEPGGGVTRGADAQEEYLCRASNLYKCLTGPNAAPFYEVHDRQRNIRNSGGLFLASDRIIYSPGVTVFRKDTGYLPYDDVRHIGSSSQEYTDEWVSIDVLTCAAPIVLYETNLPPEDFLYRVFNKRVRNIFEAAMDNDIEVLVLGAFGCGAFRNPPKTVARAFGDVLREKRYENAFSDVIFAVKRTGWYCENSEAFEEVFSSFKMT